MKITIRKYIGKKNTFFVFIHNECGRLIQSNIVIGLEEANNKASELAEKYEINYKQSS